MVEEVTNSSVKLKWDAPENDGGSKISHYVVERKPKRKDSDDEEPEYEEVMECQSKSPTDQSKFEILHIFFKHSQQKLGKLSMNSRKLKIGSF